MLFVLCISDSWLINWIVVAEKHSRLVAFTVQSVALKSHYSTIYKRWCSFIFQVYIWFNPFSKPVLKSTSSILILNTKSCNKENFACIQQLQAADKSIPPLPPLRHSLGIFEKMYHFAINDFCTDACKNESILNHTKLLFCFLEHPLYHMQTILMGSASSFLLPGPVYKTKNERHTFFHWLHMMRVCAFCWKMICLCKKRKTAVLISYPTDQQCRAMCSNGGVQCYSSNRLKKPIPVMHFLKYLNKQNINL